MKDFCPALELNFSPHIPTHLSVLLSTKREWAFNQMHVTPFWTITPNFTLAHFMYLSSYIYMTNHNKQKSMNRCHKKAVERVRFSAEPCTRACMFVFLIVYACTYVRPCVRDCTQMYVNVLSFWVLGQDCEMDAPDWGCVSFLSPVRRPVGSWPSEEWENIPRWAASTGRAPRRNGSLVLAPTGWYILLTPTKHSIELYWPEQTLLLSPMCNDCKRDDSIMTTSFKCKLGTNES